jgi:hypothetical protein
MPSAAPARKPQALFNRCTNPFWMKRIDEKVKDIVEVRAHGSLVDFTRDPLQTLVGYHFTDITADLMAKWVNAAAGIGSGRGSGIALAGFRGVGKSHFLAAFGAMLAHPEFRSRIAEPFVASAAQSLLRRSYPVANVRRGTQTTLIAEIKDAVGHIVGCESSALSDSISELLKLASESAGDCPLVLMIDTALGRTARVARDDGALLAEIADIGKERGMFVGIALDDDISGADGINSAISRSFRIDYLDQEHLYRIVDSHIFPKHERMRPVLHDIYDGYRSTVPGFRWSEDRFRSLYPLHPSIMEIAPFVRLYMPDFALLGFASEAGSRILGRPADSLIGPDEVFDKVENQLRTVDDLRDAFIAFDRVNDVVVSKTPVMKRLQAKLILKGMFLFSLNDDGATATEIGASMLILDRYEPDDAGRQVESILQAFAAAAPDQIRVRTDAGGGLRYAFRIDGKDDLKTALQTAADSVSDDVVSAILKKQMEERFSDCTFQSPADDERTNFAECSTVWRGGLRKGSVCWGVEGHFDNAADDYAGLDWAGIVEPIEAAANRVSGHAIVPIISWCPAPLTSDESATVKRFHVLMTDTVFRGSFHEHLSGPVQSHAVAVEKIFQRSMLTAGVLAIDGFEYNFTEEARSAQSLSQVFTIMIESLFEGHFPLHPYFPKPVRMQEVSQLVAELFGGASPDLAATQELAADLGEPLGVVTRSNDHYSPADQDILRKLPLAARVLSSMNTGADEVRSLTSIFEMLSAPPYGLVREASYLLLAAMVSARLIEFVTSNGDRINHRSLDLQLIWEDIVGIAIPRDAGYSPERLAMWAGLLTSDHDISSISLARGREAAAHALREWQVRWESRRLNARFDEVDDERLDTRVWRLARSSARAFQTVSEAVSAVLDKVLSIEDGLERIADAFSDSESEFARLSADLVTVEEFIVRAHLLEQIAGWVSLCEFTGNPELDHLRLELDSAAHAAVGSPGYRSNVDLRNLWQKFRSQYSSYFLDRHDEILVSGDSKQKLIDIFRTDSWWEFEKMSAADDAGTVHRARALSLATAIRDLDCRYDTKRLLESMPACGCAFTLERAELIGSMPDELWSTVNDGLAACRAAVRKRMMEGGMNHDVPFSEEVDFSASSEEFHALLESMQG